MKRKFLAVSLISLLLLFRTASIAFAAHTADADIPVRIDGGGTAYMIPEVNSPLPKEVIIRVDNGRTGHFYINFTEAGVFHYTIKAGFIRNGEEQPAEEVFRLTVTVYEQDGTLYTVSVINSSHSAGKPDAIRFHEVSQVTTTSPSDTTKVSPIIDGTTVPPTSPNGTTEGTTRPDDTTEGTTRPDDTTGSTTSPSGTTEGTTRPYQTTEPATRPEETTRRSRFFSTPKTGDESHLVDYLLIAIASSAGLFSLALLYAINTKKLIEED